ncbi:MAG: hypothetical protein QM752_01915 [Gammaproteobacteria bacterium]
MAEEKRLVSSSTEFNSLFEQGHTFFKREAYACAQTQYHQALKSASNPVDQSYCYASLAACFLLACDKHNITKPEKELGTLLAVLHYYRAHLLNPQHPFALKQSDQLADLYHPKKKGDRKKLCQDPQYFPSAL